MRFIPWYIVLLLTAPAQSRTMRVAIAQFSHESNSFNPAHTAYADFLPRTNPIAALRMEKDEVSGFLAGCEQYGMEPYLTLLTLAVPKGPVTADAYDRITAEIIDRLHKAPHLDGLLLALHGAMVSEKFPEADAETVRRLRAALGPDFPIVVTHDYHANVSEAIVHQ